MKATKALTVVVINHSNRKTTENDQRSAAGSAAENAAVDAVYYFERKSYFSEDVEGQVKIKVKHDRRGRLRNITRTYRVGGQGAGNAIRFQRMAEDELGEFPRIKRDLEKLLLVECERKRFTQKMRTGSQGDRAEVRKALRALASENVKSTPNRTPGVLGARSTTAIRAVSLDKLSLWRQDAIRCEPPAD